MPRPEEQIWELAAFLGRYANQPVSEVLGLPVTDLRRFTQATRRILNEEAEAAKNPRE